jgi:hypothetical protein
LYGRQGQHRLPDLPAGDDGRDPWESLSPQALATVEVLAPLILSGYSYSVAATLIGQSPDWVSDRWLELREEIEQVLAE